MGGNEDEWELFEKLYSYGYDGDFTIEKTVLANDGTVDLDELNRNVELLRKLIAKREVKYENSSCNAGNRPA